MKIINTIFLTLSLLSLGTISAVSVQDLIDSGQLPEIEIDLAGDKTLYLDNKDLTNLEGLQNIPNIDQVEKLYLYNNKLTQLQPNTFNGLTKLIELYLSSNQLTQLQPNTFNGLTNLKWLHLENNQLTLLQPNTFNGLTNLKWLQLDNNKLTLLQPNTFNGLTNLKWLLLENNQLTQLQPNTFNGLTNLEWLNLDNNQLTLLHPNTFNSLLNAWVSLRNNYLNFDTLNLKNNYDALLRHDEQKNPFDLAIKKFGQEKNIFNALRAREMGLRQLMRPLHVSKKRKRDSSDNESPAKRTKR